uniref:acyl-CoA 6-desaturase-like n=1 Tax=Pristiophorus japonicus TaxID=55135 RepID=UPI00398E7B18
MGKGGEKGEQEGGCEKRLALYTWEEIQKNKSKTDKWLVIDEKVYNITNWALKHPGGLRVISHYAGEDVTDAFRAFHPDLVRKFMKPLLIGELSPGEPSQDRQKKTELIEDFRALRKTAEDMKLFDTDLVFFSLYLGHLFVLEFLAWLTLSYFGTGWIATLLTALILATSQAQSGWLQHDFGHLSVFRTSKWNHLLHKFLIARMPEKFSWPPELSPEGYSIALMVAAVIIYTNIFLAFYECTRYPGAPSARRDQTAHVHAENNCQGCMNKESDQIL